MGDVTGIQWTDHSFNPWMGCQRVSPGCENCYAEALVTTRMKLPVWGAPKPTERKRTAVANWRKPLAWDRAAAKAGKRARVFCASLADVFEDHPSLPAWRADLFKLIEQTPNLDWQLLTKRPENLRKMLPASWLETPRPNVWLGTTVEDMLRARRRVLHLLETPAALRFLSVEPQLEAIDLTAISQWDPIDENDPLAVLDALRGHVKGPDDMLGATVGWVIVGGESGAGARPFDLEWSRSIVAQCRGAGVPVFVKQMGAKPVETASRCPATGDTDGSSGCGLDECAGGCRYRRSVTRDVALRDSHGGDPAEWPEDLRVREMPEVRA